MGTEKTLLIEVADRIGVDDEIAVLTALGELARTWQTMANDIDGANSALALLTAIAGGAQDENIAKAFKKIGAEKHLQTLQDAGARLTGLIDRLPASLRTLLEPVGAFDEAGSGVKDQGLLRWPLLDKSIGTASEAPADRPSYALSLGASAAIAIEAGASWPYSDDLPGPLLRLGAEGSLKPKASGTLPFGAVSVGASASASAACAIEYYFVEPDPRRIVALAAGQRLGQLVDPFDFDAVWNGFAHSDLAGIHYRFEGSAALDVSVSLADAGALAADIKAEVGASLSIGLGLEGKYFLTFRAGPKGPDGSPQIIAALSREKTESGKLGIRFGGTIDLGALATKLHAILARALGQWDEVLQSITPYLSPGTLLREKAGAKIDAIAAALVRDDALREALASDLRGVIGTDVPDESALAGWLGKTLDGALDAAQGWADDQAAAADRLLDSLGRTLPAFARDEVRTRLSGAAAELVADAADQLRAKVEALFDDQADALGKALQKLGAVANKRLADADAALAGVRKLIARYDALFRKLLAATEDAARAKVSIAVQIEEARLTSQTMEIAGSFFANSDGARAAFRALTQGDFTALLRLLDGGDSAPGFLLDPARSSLKRYAGSTGKFGMEVVMFGFGVSGSELLGGEASVLVDGTGKVQVDASGRLQKRFAALDADREIELVSSFSLVRARALATAPPAADRSIGLAVTIGHIDEGLKRHEVERFVGSLASEGLVRPAAPRLAQRTFTDWIGNPGTNGKLAATLQLKFALDRTSIGRLLFLGDGPQGIAETQRRLVVRRAFDLLADSVPEQRPLVDQTIAFFARRQPQRSLDDLLMDRKRTHRSLLENITGSHVPRLPAASEPFDDAMRLAHGMLELIEHLRRIYFSVPEERADRDPSTWSPADYRDAERAAAKAVREWLQLNTILFWTDSAVHPRTIAFLQTIASLGGVDPLDGVSLTMWRKDPDGRPETIVLSHPAASD